MQGLIRVFYVYIITYNSFFCATLSGGLYCMIIDFSLSSPNAIAKMRLFRKKLSCSACSDLVVDMHSLPGHVQIAQTTCSNIHLAHALI